MEGTLYAKSLASSVNSAAGWVDDPAQAVSKNDKSVMIKIFFKMVSY